MRYERALPCLGELHLRVRTVAAENEPLDRVGEAIVAIAVGHKIRSLPHLLTRVAHGNAKTSPLEHRTIIATVTNDGNLRQRDSQQLRQLRQCDALVGKRMANVEIVRL